MSTATDTPQRHLLQVRQRTPERQLYLVPLVCAGQHPPGGCIPQEVVDPASGLRRVPARRGDRGLLVGEWTLTGVNQSVTVLLLGVALGHDGPVQDRRFHVGRVLHTGDTLTVTVSLS